MSYGQSELYTLMNVSGVTSLLGDSSFIFYDTVVPDSVGSTQITSNDGTINYYRVGPVDGGESMMQTEYSINCRADSMSEAEAINRAVFDVVNRHSTGSVFFVANVLPTIPPADDTGNYNAPLEVTAKARTI